MLGGRQEPMQLSGAKNNIDFNAANGRSEMERPLGSIPVDARAILSGFKQI
jgi:hypothetical protein